ncbi:putative cell division cycle protein [Phaeomoniella chlamydospora]|uniref:Putative cell division cycle protein n=1 Tax=Phaeomoniella chlamydospora TaxID=158046 RepID=A0A0G2F2S5_PHACM|nr:putative cell division cycle protein [Phaeomoniella chlamydospora]
MATAKRLTYNGGHMASEVTPCGVTKLTEWTQETTTTTRYEAGADEDEDEDEETLQLRLAAIEAKLRLKKLQQSKARELETGAENEQVDRQRPTSSLNRTSSTRIASRNQSIHQPLRNRVEVPLSPTKRQTDAAEPRSPSRILLGIDKGWTGNDVSLGRTPSGRSNSSRLISRTSKYDTTRSNLNQISSSSQASRPKSFSERLAEGRAQEATRQARNEEIQRRRSSGFKLNEEELEGFRLAAEEAKAHAVTSSPTRKSETVDYGREAVLAAFHDNKGRGLTRSRTTPNLARADSEKDDSTNSYGGDASLYDPFSQLHLSSRVLPHSFLKRTFESAEPVRLPWLLRNIVSPDYELPSAITGDFVVFGIVASKSTPLNHRTGTDAQSKGSDDWEKKWDDGSQNEKRFMAMTLTDLNWTIDLYLFGTALPRYHRLSPGTLIAILNPGIMPPKPGKQDSGQFSLSLNSGADIILEIGTARDLGFCQSVKKDGKQCSSWVDSSKSEFCDWHVDAQVRKTQAGRMGVNSSASSILSSNRFGGGGTGYGSRRTNSKRGRGEGIGEVKGHDLLSRDGSHYDRSTGTKFFALPSSAPAYNRNNNANRPYSALGDDPFLVEGALSRDNISKNERLRKRIATEAKEREIARKLGESDLGRGRSAAGGEYLRKRSEGQQRNCSAGSTPNSSSNADGSSLSSAILSSGTKSSTTARSNILSSASSTTAARNSNGKRSAEDVRLSPVKKKASLPSSSSLIGRRDDKADGDKSVKNRKVTRFITEKGIREAGRESLPGPGHGAMTNARNRRSDYDYNDDDDLDIV